MFISEEEMYILWSLYLKEVLGLGVLISMYEMWMFLFVHVILSYMF